MLNKYADLWHSCHRLRHCLSSLLGKTRDELKATFNKRHKAPSWPCPLSQDDNLWQTDKQVHKGSS